MLEKLHLNVSRQHVYNLMVKLGYRWSMGKKRGSRILESAKKQADTWRLALEWSQALQLEEAGTHVVVYMDESFVNTGHCHRYSWFLVEQSLVRFDDQGTWWLMTMPPLWFLSKRVLISIKNHCGNKRERVSLVP